MPISVKILFNNTNLTIITYIDENDTIKACKIKSEDNVLTINNQMTKVICVIIPEDISAFCSLLISDSEYSLINPFI